MKKATILSSLLIVFILFSADAQPPGLQLGRGKVKMKQKALDEIFAAANSSGGCLFRTQTQGGWGAFPHGHNPATYLYPNFDNAFPDSLVVGCDSGYTLTLTSAAAITQFLPSGSQPRALTQSYIDPARNYRNVLAGQLVALTLSVGFDNYDPNFGSSSTNLADATITSGPFAGWTVQMVLDTANMVFGGCSSNYRPSQMVDILSSINESFVDGSAHNAGLLSCDTTGCTVQLAYVAEGNCLGEPTQIVNLSTGVDSGAVYYLDLFNDGTIDATANASHLPGDTSIIFPSAGIWEFSAIVVNPDGCSDTLVSSIEIEDCQPDCSDLELDFELEDVCEGEPLCIENQSQGVDPDAIYYLDLNSDGSFELSATASDLPNDSCIVLPLAAGNYDFTVVVVNPDGCSDTLSSNITVHPNPQIAFEVDTTCVGLPTVLTNLSTGVDSDAVYYLDLFNDGNVEITIPASELPSDTAVTIPFSGTFPFTAVVVNGTGCADTTTGTIVVLPQGNCDGSGVWGGGGIQIGPKRSGKEFEKENGLSFNAYPNPFKKAINLRLSVDETQYVKMAVFALDGQRITTIYEGVLDKSVVLDYKLTSNDLPGGVYACKVTLSGSGKTLIRKIISIK